MGSSQKAALEHVADRFATMKKASVFWPTVPFDNLEWEINARIKDPSRIYQAKSNLCGMASFFNALATDDPYLYAYFLCSVYRTGSAYLGYGKDAPIVKVSKQTRSSQMPPMIAGADWITLASLRDHLNAVLDYRYSVGVTGLKDIPLLGIFGTPNFIEPLGGITTPDSLANALLALGYKVINKASILSRGGLERLQAANHYLKNGYRVFILVNTGLYEDDAPALSFSADHWVRLTGPIEGATKAGKTYYRCRAYDPAEGGTCWIPTSGNYQHKNAFLGHFYGYVAARR